MNNAEGSTIGNLIFLSKKASLSAVIEELYHAKQNLAGLNDDKNLELRSILNEIDAKMYMIANAQRLRIPRLELEETKRHLEEYQKELADYWESRGGEDV